MLLVCGVGVNIFYALILCCNGPVKCKLLCIMYKDCKFIDQYSNKVCLKTDKTVTSVSKQA